MAAMTFRALEKIANNLSAHDRGGKGEVGQGLTLARPHPVLYRTG